MHPWGLQQLPQNNHIPTARDIDADWLSQLLGQSITSVTAQAVGTGQVGATFRFHLVTNQSDLPTTLIGKFMSEEPISRATGIAQMSYLREVKFYQRFGSGKPLPIPSVRFAAIDEVTHDFALIMGDFPSHRVGNQLEPATLAQARLAMGAAAQIHAAWWGSEELDTHFWLNGAQSAPTMNVDGLFNMLWPGFCARYADRINEQILAAGKSYLGRINDWIARRTGPRCLTHGDFRPDNMLFNESDPNDPIVIVDWQTAGVGNGATDIAYYLGTAVSPDMRREHERALVALWTQGLADAGVPASQTALMWDAYRRDAVAGFLMGVLASMIVTQTDRGDAMFLEMCTRSAAMIHDHDSAALI